MDLSGEEVSRMQRALARDSFDEALVNLVGRQLTEEEAKRTEDFIASFQK